MSTRRPTWSVLALAILCLLPVVGGVLLLVSGGEGSASLGWALVGFFGSGVVVLARRAFAAG